MHIFRLFESDGDEEDFRWRYSSIREAEAPCHSSMQEGKACSNTCRYLLSNDFDATNNGYPAAFGIDCDVEVLCWDGDIDDVTVEVYCRDCAREQYRARQAEEEIKRRQNEALAKARERSALEEAQSRQTSLDHWLNLSDKEFESECAMLFRRMGFSAEITPATNDGGIDIRLTKDGKHGAVQCKAWKQPCGVRELREFHGTLHVECMTFGYFIARGGFTKNAKLLLQKMPLVTGWDTTHLRGSQI